MRTCGVVGGGWSCGWPNFIRLSFWEAQNPKQLRRLFEQCAVELAQLFYSRYSALHGQGIVDGDILGRRRTSTTRPGRWW